MLKKVHILIHGAMIGRRKTRRDAIESENGNREERSRRKKANTFLVDLPK